MRIVHWSLTEKCESSSSDCSHLSITLQASVMIFRSICVSKTMLRICFRDLLCSSVSWGILACRIFNAHWILSIFSSFCKESRLRSRIKLIVRARRPLIWLPISAGETSIITKSSLMVKKQFWEESVRKEFSKNSFSCLRKSSAGLVSKIPMVSHRLLISGGLSVDFTCKARYFINSGYWIIDVLVLCSERIFIIFKLLSSSFFRASAALFLC